MASNIKGITIEIGGSTTKLQKALGDVNKKSKDLQSELKQVDRLLKLDPGNATLVAQKQQLLAESVENTKEKLDKLKEAERQVQQQFAKGDANAEQYREIQREVIQTEQSLEKLEKQAKQSAASMSTSFANAGDKITTIGQKASIASAAIVAGVGAAAKSALDAADEYVRLSDETGLSLSQLQEYAYVGSQVGVEIDTIAGAQAKLTKSMSAARGGTGAQANAFKTLGISVTDANGNLKDAKSVMGEAFAALNNVGNETERDALSMSLFGKSAMDLNPLIKLGADGLSEMEQKARDVGAVMDDETIKSLDDFGDSMAGLKMSVMGAVGETLTPFIEKLGELVNWFSNLSEGTKGFILAILGIIAAIGPLLIVIGMISSGIGAIIPIIAAIASPIGLVVVAIAGLIAIGVALYKNWDSIKAKASELWSSVTATFDGIKNSIAEKINSAKDAVRSAIDKIKSFFNFNWTLPKIKLPHFSIKGKFSLSPPQIPTFGVNWYKTGGIFSSPSVIGVGEAGTEVVAPLDELKSMISKSFSLQGATTVNHTGTIRVEGVNDKGELVAVIEQKIANSIAKDNRRMTDRANTVPFG